MTGNTEVLSSPLAFLFPSLQMAVLEIQGNGDSSYVPQEAISSAIQLLEDPLQRVRVFRVTSSLTDFGNVFSFSSMLPTGNVQENITRKDRQKQ